MFKCLSILKEVVHGADFFNGLNPLFHGLRTFGCLHMQGITHVLRGNRNLLKAFATSSWIPLSLNSKRDRIDIQCALCCLTQRDVGNTGTQNSEYALDRGKAKVSTTEIGRIIVQNQILIVNSQLSYTIGENLYPWALLWSKCFTQGICVSLWILGTFTHGPCFGASALRKASASAFGFLAFAASAFALLACRA